METKPLSEAERLALIRDIVMYVALTVTSISSLSATWIGYANSHAIIKTQEAIESVEHHTNSMATKLNESIEKEAHARGVKEGEENPEGKPDKDAKP